MFITAAPFKWCKVLLQVQTKKFLEQHTAYTKHAVNVYQLQSCSGDRQPNVLANLEGPLLRMLIIGYLLVVYCFYKNIYCKISKLTKFWMQPAMVSAWFIGSSLGWGNGGVCGNGPNTSWNSEWVLYCLMPKQDEGEVADISTQHLEECSSNHSIYLCVVWSSKVVEWAVHWQLPL